MKGKQVIKMTGKKELVLDEKMVQSAKCWAEELCKCAGADEAFCQDFWDRLCRDKEILEEFVYYLVYQDFLYQVKIQGYGLVDLMIFQIDHFKATMDQDVADMRHNKDKMLLMAFNSLLLMRKNPEPFVEMIQSQTGTEYPGKF